MAVKKRVVKKRKLTKKTVTKKKTVKKKAAPPVPKFPLEVWIVHSGNKIGLFTKDPVEISPSGNVLVTMAKGYRGTNRGKFPIWADAMAENMTDGNIRHAKLVVDSEGKVKISVDGVPHDVYINGKKVAVKAKSTRRHTRTYREGYLFLGDPQIDANRVRAEITGTNTCDIEVSTGCRCDAAKLVQGWAKNCKAKIEYTPATLSLRVDAIGEDTYVGKHFAGYLNEHY